MTSADYLHTAYLLAKKANSKNIRPNPFVGALVVDINGDIIGEGYHKKAGEAHAEVEAIHNALQKINNLSKCTLYVTLEPCSYTGKTPPCTDLILAHKIPKVVIGSMDPNPLVSGAAILKSAGVQVETCILPEIEALNSTFIINQVQKRPKYILKSATTLNGKIGDRFGNSKWISNEHSRNYVHSVLRTNADAILTTAKTVIKDNATMNIRLSNEDPKELNVIIIDRFLSLLEPHNKDLSIFYQRKESKIFLLTDKEYKNVLPENIEIINAHYQDGTIDLSALNKFCLSKNICEILVEGGGKLNAALIKKQFIDEIAVFVCPSIIMDNNALTIFNLEQLQTIEECTKLILLDFMKLGEDVLLKYKVTHTKN